MKKICTIILVSMLSSLAFAQSTMDSSSDVSNMPAAKHTKDFSITPSVNLLDFPHPFDGAVELVFSEAIGIKYSQSFRPHGNIDGDKADIDNRSIAIRSYSGGGPFWFGLAYGHHEINVQRNDQVNGFDTNIYASVESDYVSPMIGWKWVYDSGFTVGVELGWIFPFNSKSDVNADEQYRQQRSDAQDQAEKYGKNGLPTVSLLELGWTF
jgi:hypothetical protein